MASSVDAGLREPQGFGGGVELDLEAERQEPLLVEVAEGRTARRWDADPAQALGDDVEVLQVYGRKACRDGTGSGQAELREQAVDDRALEGDSPRTLREGVERRGHVGVAEHDLRQFR